MEKYSIKVDTTPRRTPKKKIQGVIPYLLACPKCGGEVKEFEEKFIRGHRCTRCKWKVEIPTGKIGVIKKAWQKTYLFVNGWKTAGGIAMAGIGALGIVGGAAGAWLQIAGYALAGLGIPTLIGGVGHKLFKKKHSIENKEGEKVSWLDVIIEILSSLKNVLMKGGEK